jgi:hypothetical protein
MTAAAIILLVLWQVGLVSSYTLGGFLYILLGDGADSDSDAGTARKTPDSVRCMCDRGRKMMR